MRTSRPPRSKGRWALAVLLAGSCALVLYSRVYRDFERVRVRVVQESLASAEGSISVALPDLSGLQGHATAIIVRLANQRAEPTSVEVLVGGEEIGRLVVGPRQATRFPLSLANGAPATDVSLVVRADVDGWSLDYLEVSNLHGYSDGLLAFVVVPAAAERFSSVPGFVAALLFVGLVSLAAFPRAVAGRAARSVLGGIRAIGLVLAGVALAAPLVSDYKLLLAPSSFVVLVLLLYLPVLHALLVAIGGAIPDDSRFARLKSKELWGNLRLSAASVVLSLLVLELGVRVTFYMLDTDEILEDLRAEEEQANTTPGMALYRQTRISSNPRIIYELRPNSTMTDAFGNTHQVNDVGFRGPLIPLEKAPGTVRIVGLGDSFMYGFNVAEEEAYLRVLSDRLNKEYPEVRWEIVNTAVSGYNTVMEVETLKAKGLAYEPDIVVIGFVGNDLGLPNFIRKRVSLFEPRSFLIDFVSGRSELLRSRLVDTSNILGTGIEDINWNENPDAAPPEYQDMVGVDAYRRAMGELAGLRDEYGFELFLLTRARRDYVIETTTALGIPIVDVRTKVDAYMAEHGIEQWQGSILAVSDEDPHPSALGHRLYADAVFEYMRDSGLIEGAIRRALQPPTRTP